MKLLVIVLTLLIATNCYATLYRYTDNVTGDEMGIQYSDKPIDNPAWNSQVITEDQKQSFIDKKKQQDDKKKDDASKEKDRKIKKCSKKLKDLGFDKDEVEIILGDGSY